MSASEPQKSPLPQGDIQVGYYSKGETVDSMKKQFSGYIEPLDLSWIIFLDQEGKPALYWNARTETGAVIGDPVLLNA